MARLTVTNPAALRRRGLLAGAAAAGLAGGAAAQVPAIRGMASYRERMALPPGVVLDVVLEDISRAGAPALRIAGASIPVQGQVPIAFTLPYDPARIEQRNSYAVRATLRREERVLFRTDRIHPVLTRGHGETVELLLVRAAAAPAPAATPALIGPRWVAAAIAGAAPEAGVVSDITFAPDGNAFGMGGCNRFRGGYRLEGAAGLSIGPLASTMMACEGPKSAQERRFHDALGSVRRWRLEGEALVLEDAGGAAALRLHRG